MIYSLKNSDFKLRLKYQFLINRSDFSLKNINFLKKNNFVKNSDLESFIY